MSYAFKRSTFAGPESIAANLSAIDRCILASLDISLREVLLWGGWLLFSVSLDYLLIVQN